MTKHAAHKPKRDTRNIFDVNQGATIKTPPGAEKLPRYSQLLKTIEDKLGTTKLSCITDSLIENTAHQAKILYVESDRNSCVIILAESETEGSYTFELHSCPPGDHHDNGIDSYPRAEINRFSLHDRWPVQVFNAKRISANTVFNSRPEVKSNYKARFGLWWEDELQIIPPDRLSNEYFEEQAQVMLDLLEQARELNPEEESSIISVITESRKYPRRWENILESRSRFGKFIDFIGRVGASQRRDVV